jgi:GntR family transcriptional regulator/MocR family aminotransferase
MRPVSFGFMDVHVSLVGRKDLSGEIYRQLRQAIVAGRLRPGDALPPTRALARSLSVSRTTVTLAYDRLSGEGFVHARVGSGTFVSAQAGRQRPSPNRKRPSVAGTLEARLVWNQVALPAPSFYEPAPFDFRTGPHDASLFPHATWRRLVAHSTRESSLAGGDYGRPAGLHGLRSAIARHIGTARAVEARPDDICVTSGTQQAIDILARVLLAPGDVVAVEDPGYQPPRRLLESLGLRVVGVPVDREGLVVDALPRQARLVYVTPSHQYPLGVPMSLPRRLALLAWAARHGAAIVEDDYDSEFRFGARPIEPLRVLDASGRVIYVGSFSKTMLPALRLGFAVIPPSIREAVWKAKFVTDWHTSLLAQAALASFMESGAYARHLRRVHTAYRERHARVVEGIATVMHEHLELVPSEAGLHVAALAPTASHERTLTVTELARQAGVAVQPLARFRRDTDVPAGFLIGYGAISADRVGEGLHLLRQSLQR